MIEVSELRKRYGATQSLDGMTFRVLPGQVTGFVGPNGAGKSTTMRIILGLDAADAGTALIGWLACSQGLTARRVDEVIDQAGLRSAIRRKAGGYSLGMRQRLGIAAALLGDPPVLILDEPINGLDPDGIIWARHFLRALAAEGRAVLLSSHLMSELQALLTSGADHLVVVGHGKVLADTSVAALLSTTSADRVQLRTADPARAATVLTRAGATAVPTAPDILMIEGLTAERIVVLLTQNSIPFTEVTPHRASLEQAYLELTREAVTLQFKSQSRGRQS